jgi:ASC-1-like (ASCH) protein
MRTEKEIRDRINDANEIIAERKRWIIAKEGDLRVNMNTLRHMESMRDMLRWVLGEE